MPLESKTEVAENLFRNHKESKEQSPVQYPVKSLKGDSCIVLPDIHGAYLSASATVEASLVIPVFIYAVMAVMYIMQMIMVQVKVQESLYNTGRQVAKYAYFYDCMSKGMNGREDIIKTREQDLSGLDSGLQLAGAQALFIKEIGTQYAKQAGVIGGSAGFVMLGSKIMEGNKEIFLEVSYVLKNPFDIFGIALKKFTQEVSLTAWIGDDKCMGVEADDTLADSADREYVYITASGEVYHTRKSCTYLQPSVRQVKYADVQNIRNEGGAKYYQCEYCAERAEVTGVVYITSYGNRWHTSSKCPKINRNIMKVLKASVSDRKMCSKCKAGE